MRCQQWIRNDANHSLKNISRMLLKGSNNCVSHMASKPNAQWFENDFQNLKSLGDYKNTKLETQTKPQPATTKSKFELHPPPTTRTLCWHGCAVMGLHCPTDAGICRECLAGPSAQRDKESCPSSLENVLRNYNVFSLIWHFLINDFIWSRIND